MLSDLEAGKKETVQEPGSMEAHIVHKNINKKHCYFRYIVNLENQVEWQGPCWYREEALHTCKNCSSPAYVLCDSSTTESLWEFPN